MDVVTAISLLALIASVSANVIAEKARRASRAAERTSAELARAQKRTELLLALETQRATAQKLASVYREKLALFSENVRLGAAHNRESARIRENLALLAQDQSDQNRQVELASGLGPEGSIVSLEHSLADIQRLNIKIANEFRNEEQALEALRRVPAPREYREL